MQEVTERDWNKSEMRMKQTDKLALESMDSRASPQFYSFQWHQNTEPEACSEVGGETDDWCGTNTLAWFILKSQEKKGQKTLENF